MQKFSVCIETCTKSHHFDRKASRNFFSKEGQYLSYGEGQHPRRKMCSYDAVRLCLLPHYNIMTTAYSSRFALFSVSGFKDDKMIKSKSARKLKLYSRVFRIFQSNAVTIDPYNLELYHCSWCVLRHSAYNSMTMMYYSRESLS